MRVIGTITVSAAILLAWCSAATAQQVQDTKPVQVQQKQPNQTRRRQEPVKVVDIAPETATHLEGEPLHIEFKRLTALRMGPNDSLLACDGDAKVIKIISASGHQVGTIELPFAPEALDIAADGTLYCGGEGQLAKLSKDGRVVKTEIVPDDVAPGAAAQDVEPQASAGTNEASQQGEGTERKPATQRRRRKPRPKKISGIAVTDQDVFVAFGSGWSLGSKSKLYRFDLALEDPQPLAEGLRGCCQRCDIKCRDGVLYLAENSAHRVVRYDRAGNVLAKWGERGRNDLKTFGACCNPMNLCFDGQGVIYTAESGLGRIKRYTSDGQFLDLVGYVGTERFWNGSGLAASCSNMAIAVTGDGQRVYVMDYKNSQIRVLEKKATEENAEAR